MTTSEMLVKIVSRHRAGLTDREEATAQIRVVMSTAPRPVEEILFTVVSELLSTRAACAEAKRTRQGT